MRAVFITNHLGIAKRVGCLIAVLAVTVPAFAVPFPPNDPGSDPLAHAHDLESQGKVPEAREVYRDIIESNPNNLAARRSLIESYIESYAASRKFADVDSRADELADLLKEQPDYAAAWALSGDFVLDIVKIKEGSAWQRGAANNILKRFVSSLAELPGGGWPDLVGPLPVKLRSAVTRKALTSLLQALYQPSLLSMLADHLEKTPDAPGIQTVLLDLAKHFFAKAMDLAPADADLLMTIANSYWKLNAIEPSDEHERAAYEVAVKAAELVPRDHKALALAGRICLRRAEAFNAEEDGAEQKQALLASAEEYYRQAIRFSSSFPQIINSLMLVYAEQEKTDDGVRYFRNLGDESEDEDVKILSMQAIAQLYAADGQTDKTEAQWQAIMEAYPDNLSPYMPLAQFYVEAEQYDKAIALLGEALKEHPTFLDGCVNLGLLYVKTGRTREAEAHFLKVIRLLEPRSHNPDSYTFALDIQQDAEEAIMDLFGTALTSLSQIYSDRRHYLKAGDVIENYKLIYFQADSRGRLIRGPDNQLLPRRPERSAAAAMYRAGIAYHNARRHNQAVECLTKAIRITDGKFYLAQDALAQVYMATLGLPNADYADRLEAVENARQVWENILSYRPEDQNAQLRLAKVLLDIAVRSPDQLQSIKNKKTHETGAGQALAILTALLDSQPNNSGGMLLRATIYEFVDENENALRDAQAVCAMKPGAAVKPTTSGLEFVSEAELKQHQIAALVLMARIHSEPVLDLDKAEELARNALKNKPRSPDLRVMLLDIQGWINFQKAKAEPDPEARKKFLMLARAKAKRAASLYPLTRFVYHFAEISLMLGSSPKERQDLIEQLADALQSDPFSLEAERAKALLERLKQ